MAAKRIVLVGAGHAHLYALRASERFRRRGHELVVVAPEAFWYSGLATGMLGGAYPPELDQVDVAQLAHRGGASFIQDKLVGLERSSRDIILARHGRLRFDALSLNLGSAPPAIPGSDQPGVYAVKPIHRLRDLRSDLEARFASEKAPVRVVIAGAGPTGSELAGNISGLARSAGARVHIVVLAGGDRVLGGVPDGAAAAMRDNLERRGIRFRTGSRVVRLEKGRAVLAGSGDIAFDIFVNATGLTPSPVLRDTDLPLTEEGAMIVDAHLRSPADPVIHGGGDCIAFEGAALPRIGVHAIRQAPVLLRNLIASVEGLEPGRFAPQRNYLWIMNLGDGTGVAVHGNLWCRGRSAFLLKDWIDRRFLRAYGSA